MDPAIENLIAQARQHGIPEKDVLQAWEEMRSKYRLPWYVVPTLEASTFDGAIMLQPAVNINLLSRAIREVPGFEDIRGPVWPGTVIPEAAAEVESLLAKTEEGSPLRKYCCQVCSECVPKELLEKSRQGDRLTWIKTHYQAKHPTMWGKLPGSRHTKAWPAIQ